MKCGRCDGDSLGHYTLYRPSPGERPKSVLLCCWCNIRLGYAPYKDHMCKVARRALLDDPTLDLSDDVMSKATQERFIKIAKEELDKKMKEHYGTTRVLSNGTNETQWFAFSSNTAYNYPFQYNYTINTAPQAQNRRIVIDEFARIGDEVRRQRVEDFPPAWYPQRIMHVWDEMRLAGEAPPDEERAEGRNG